MQQLRNTAVVLEAQSSCGILGLKIGYPWLPHFRTQPLVFRAWSKVAVGYALRMRFATKNPEHLGVHLSHSKSALISVFLAG